MWTYDAAPYPQPWPYVPGQPAPQPCVDTVRFLIGDTDTNDQQLQDTEIQGLLAQNVGDAYQAAIEACRALATHYARQADKTVGDLHLVASQTAKAYEAMVEQIEAQARRHGTPVPYSGGISWADKAIDRSDDDVVAPAYWKGMMDDPGTAPNYGDMDDGGGFDGFDRSIPG